MKKLIPFITASILLGVIGGCGNKKSDAALEREAWLRSLDDSIASYQKKAEEVNVTLEGLRAQVGDMLSDFEYISNPREVEGYYILKGWKDKYPPVTTGLVARVTEDERFELIAALLGGVFNEIAVCASGETVNSNVVRHDQALNYRAGNINRVCFYGTAADSVGDFIASHDANEVLLLYLNGTPSNKIKLSGEQKNMIKSTWNLYSLRKRMRKFERELPVLAGKVELCRRMLEANDSILNSGK